MQHILLGGAIHFLLCTGFTAVRATELGSSQEISSIRDDIMQTVDVVTYVKHSCHYLCIFTAHNVDPESSRCFECMKSCIENGKNEYCSRYDVTTQSALAHTTEKCDKCEDFDPDHKVVTARVICNFNYENQNSDHRLPDNYVHECIKDLLERSNRPGQPHAQGIVHNTGIEATPHRVVDLGTYITHFCHYHCVFDRGYKPPKFTVKCVVCMDRCRRQEIGKYNVPPKGIPFLSAHTNPRTKGCTTCKEFNRRHMMVTAQDMCHFLHPGGGPDADSRLKACMSRIMGKFEAQHKKPPKEGLLSDHSN